MKRGFSAAGILGVLAIFAVIGRAQGDDLVTLSGRTYRDVRAVRVEPDGVTWQHDAGMVKVDFTDSPESVRRAYHYDPAKGTAYHDAQTKARHQADEQTQKLVRAHEEHQRERVRLTLQNASETSALPDGGTAFTLRRRLDFESPAPGMLDDQIQAKKAERDLLNKDNGTVWDRRLWAIPCMILGGYSPGVAFEPGANLNPREFRASIHHVPGGFAATALQDSSNTPLYMTRSYYEDVERAEAFARGVPLK